MTENVDVKQKRPVWVPWMHVAGIAYPAAIWFFAIALFGAPSAFGMIAMAALTVGTLALIGGITRYLATK